MRFWIKFTLVTLSKNSLVMSSLSFLSFSLNTLTVVRQLDFLTKLLHFNRKNLSLSTWQFTAIERLVSTQI